MAIDNSMLLTQTTNSLSVQSDSIGAPKSAQDEFLSYMEMSTEEKYLAMYLKGEKMSMEDFKALPADEKEKIIAKIREKIREDLKKETQGSSETKNINITAATFSDPAMRSSLQAYYENKKAELIKSWDSRPTLPDEVTLTTPDGKTQTAKVIPITSEQMANALVSFDKWLEFQARSYSSDSFEATQLDMAKQNLQTLEQNNPDSRSNVRTTFSQNGVLLAYVNTDSTVATSNGTEKYLKTVFQKADQLQLSGQARVDYLNREIKTALSAHYPELETATYDDAHIPTKREFADSWYPNFDIDQNYKDMLAEAQASVDTANSMHQQWQKNLNEMRDFLVKMQEAQAA